MKTKPDGFEAFNNMGTSYVLGKDYKLAIQCFNRCLEINNNYAPAVSNLANLYNRRGDGDNSLKYSKKLKELLPDDPETTNTYAKALILNHNLGQAILLISDLVKKYPENDDFIINLATAYRESGEIKKTKQIVNERFKILFKRVKSGDRVQNLNLYFSQFASDRENLLTEEEIKYFKNKLYSEELYVDNKIILAKAFFEYYRNTKQYALSYEYLSLMNKLAFEIDEFDLKKEEAFFKKLGEDVKYPKLKMGKSSIIPIFVCGMPRSGTTLCEQILSAHSNVYGAGELRYLMQLTNIENSGHTDEKDLEEYFENIRDSKFLLQIRNDYLKMLQGLNPNKHGYVCDKMPHNFLMIDLIRNILPEAKIIYCKRSPLDNCFSLLTQRFVESRHQYCYDQKTLAEYYLLHEDLMNVWLNKYKNEIFVLDNENLVDNQKKVTEDLLNFCNLKWETICMKCLKFLKAMIKTIVQILFLIILFSLYGCGFKPIYKISDKNINTQDYSVEVINSPSREILQEISESLISNTDSNHQVLIKVEENMTPLIINTNGTISKYRIEIVIDYSLVNIDADKILVSDTVRGFSQYNVVTSEIENEETKKQMNKIATDKALQMMTSRLQSYLSKS